MPAAAIATVALLLPVPPAAGTPAATPAAAPPVVDGPQVVSTSTTIAAGDLGWYSSNWAGYVVRNGPYRSVSGQWTVPRVAATPRSTFSAIWLGIDGVDHASLIQAGTQQDFYDGSAHYSAWWEVLPAAAVTVPSISVRPGDRITARIQLVSGARWRISITDARSGSFGITVAYDGGASSAEWIEEAPVVSGRIGRLATHGSVTFDNVTANGTSPHLVTSDAGGLIQRRVLLEVPSAPDRDGNGFTLAQADLRPAPPAS